MFHSSGANMSHDENFFVKIGGNSEPPSPGLPTLEKIKSGQSGPYDFPADSPTGGNGTQPVGKTTPKAPTAPASNKVQNTPWSTFTNLGKWLR